MGGNNASSSNTLTGSILLSPKQASDGDTIPFGSSSYVQQQQNLNLNSATSSIHGVHGGVYSTAALIATASAHGYNEHENSRFGSLYVPSLWEVECEDVDDVTDVCEAIDETLSSPAFATALAKQNRSGRYDINSTSTSMNYHSCVQLSLHRHDDRQASRLSVLRLARASAQVSSHQPTRQMSSLTPKSKGSSNSNNNSVIGTSCVPAWVVALCDVLAAVEQKTPRVPFSSSRATLMLRDSLTGRTPSVFLVPVPNLDALGLATLRIATRIRSASRTLAQVVGQTYNPHQKSDADSESINTDQTRSKQSKDSNVIPSYSTSSLSSLSSTSSSSNKKETKLTMSQKSSSVTSILENADSLLKEIDQQREHDSHVNRALRRSHLLSSSSTTSNDLDRLDPPPPLSTTSPSNYSVSNVRSVSFSDNIKSTINEDIESDGLINDDDDEEEEEIQSSDLSRPTSSLPRRVAPTRSTHTSVIKSPTAVSMSIIKGATAATLPSSSSSSSSSSTSTLIPLASPTGRTGPDLEIMGNRLAATSKELFSATVEALDRSKVQVAHLAEQVQQMRQIRESSSSTKDTSTSALSLSQLSVPPPPPPPPRMNQSKPALVSISSSSDPSLSVTTKLSPTPSPFALSSGPVPKQTATSLARATMAKNKTKNNANKGSIASMHYGRDKTSSSSSTFTYDADKVEGNDTDNTNDNGNEYDQEFRDLDEAATENNTNNNDGFGYSTNSRKFQSSSSSSGSLSKTQSFQDHQPIKNVKVNESGLETTTTTQVLQQAVQNLQAEFIILRGERDRLLVESKAMQKITRDYSLYREVIQGAMTRLQKDTERLVQERDTAVASLRSEKTAHAKEKIAHTACKRRIAELEYIVSAFDATQKTKEEAASALGQLRVAIRDAAAVHTYGGMISSSKKQNQQHQQHSLNATYSEDDIATLRYEYEVQVKKATAAEERANALENELSASHVSMAQLLMATATGNALDKSVASVATSLSAATAAATTTTTNTLPLTVPTSSQKQTRRNSITEVQGQQRRSSLGNIHASSPSSSSSSSYLQTLQHRASAVGLGVKNAASNSRSPAVLSVDVDEVSLKQTQTQRPPRPSSMSSTQKIQPPSVKFELASGRVNGQLNRGPLVGTSRLSFGTPQQNLNTSSLQLGNNGGKKINNNSLSSSSSSLSTPRRNISGSGYGQTPQRRPSIQYQQQYDLPPSSSLDPTSAELLATVNNLASEVSAAVGTLYSM